MNYTPSQEALLRSIDAANNGYIPYHYLTQVERIAAAELQALGVFAPNLPYRRVKTMVERQPLPSFIRSEPSFDYEGAILSRQARFFQS
jgi:hypothetical protein